MEVPDHQTQHPVFKLILVGDGNAGKSTFADRFLTTIEPHHMPAEQAQLRNLHFKTNLGTIIFNVWDTMGQENAGVELSEVLMFDVNSRQSYKDVPLWYSQIVKYCEHIPIVLVGNKADSKDRKVKPKQVNYHRKKNLMYIETSALANWRVLEVYEWLMKKLVGDVSLKVIEPGQMRPCGVTLDLQLVSSNEQELEMTNSYCLPDDDEEDEFPPKAPTFAGINFGSPFQWKTDNK